jgi:hypothetical protein
LPYRHGLPTVTEPRRTLQCPIFQNRRCTPVSRHAASELASINPEWLTAAEGGLGF